MGVPLWRLAGMTASRDLRTFPEDLASGYEGVFIREQKIISVLTPADTGMSIESETLDAELFDNPYALVRWTDWCGMRWEHGRGEVRQVEDDEPWSP